VRLEKLFRNGIIEAVEKGGLAPRECTFDFNDDDGCYITHGPSGSSFVVEGPFGRHTTIAVVGEGAPRQLDAYSWTTVKERAERWAREVKRDVDTPDLWAELQGQREVLTGARYEDVENTPFTPDEQTEIAQQLQQIKDFVKEEHSLSEAQMRSLEGKLDYIEAATGRIGRKDWRILLRRDVRGNRHGSPSRTRRTGHPHHRGARSRLPPRRRGWAARAPAHRAPAYGVADSAGERGQF
jgi:hypothetical protein